MSSRECSADRDCGVLPTIWGDGTLSHETGVGVNGTSHLFFFTAAANMSFCISRPHARAALLTPNAACVVSRLHLKRTLKINCALNICYESPSLNFGLKGHRRQRGKDCHSVSLCGDSTGSRRCSAIELCRASWSVRDLRLAHRWLPSRRVKLTP